MFYLQTLLESIELAGGGEGLLHVGAHGKHHQVGHHQAPDRAKPARCSTWEPANQPTKEEVLQVLFLPLQYSAV